jgi:hypothetical protein
MVAPPEVNQRERALVHRLEISKQRLVADLGKLSTVLSTSAGQVGKRFVRVGIVLGGLMLLGIVTVVVRRRRRFRVRFL